jgi:subtilase family serine protease
MLEARDLPSVSSVFALPNLNAEPAAEPPVGVSPLASGSSSVVYSPAQIRAAYGFNNVSYDGRGQTIAIVTAYDDPNLLSDLARFDQAFNIFGQNQASLASLVTKVNQNGSKTSLPAGNTSWAMETTLDVEWAHAIAPLANIVVVEANSNSGLDLLTAINTARYRAGVSVVSMSWGTSEFRTETFYDSYFTTPSGHIGGNNKAGGITFVASSGDAGAWNGPEWPSVSPNVLAVGGTALSMSGNAWAGESGWSNSGGGYSAYEKEPIWQQPDQKTGYRSTPDVAYDANPSTGVYIYDSYGASGWYSVGGTSAGAPQWAGLIALADQGRALRGLGSLANAQQAVYSLPTTDFHSITQGYNGYYDNGKYNPVTGLGSPYADRVIRDLVAATTGQTTAATTTSTVNSGTSVGTRIDGLDILGPDSGGTAAFDPAVSQQAGTIHGSFTSIDLLADNEPREWHTQPDSLTPFVLDTRTDPDHQTVFAEGSTTRNDEFMTTLGRHLQPVAQFDEAAQLFE